MSEAQRVVGCVVLAAGASSRMGEPKALVRAPDGRRFLDAIVETARAAGVGPLVVVLGPPHAALIEPSVPAGVLVAHNPRPERGMLSSVQAGVAALPRVDATLMWPVDIPAVEVDTVRALLEGAPGSIVIPVHAGRGGHPLRIPSSRFAELQALDPSLGLRALMQSRPEAVLRREVDDSKVLVDVDTPEALSRLT
jgi:molybdenum cofactor cytidylyltransferase